MNRYYFFITFLAIMSSAVGQIFFKKTAIRIRTDNAELAMVSPFLVHLIQDYYFWVALIFYGTATMGWVYVLQHVALSRAYPFMALGYIIIPVLSWFIFNEPLTGRYLVGLSCIVIGIVIIGYG